MDCRESTRLIDAAVLGELRGRRLAGFRRHVSECRRCRLLLERSRWLVRLVDCVLVGLRWRARRTRRKAALSR